MSGLHASQMSAVAIPFLVALALSAALVPLCRILAVRAGRLSQPREDRWHRRPVALFGGVAIGASLFAGAAGFGVVTAAPVLVACAVLAFLTGLVDDLIRLKPATKLIVQIALGSTLLFFDYRINWVESITLDSLLTLAWVVGLTNAFNLLDNMDGLCAGIALIVGAALLVDLVPGASGAETFAHVRFLSLLLGATAGFLVYNIHPASIFMGDSGSLLLGFSVAAATLNTTHASTGRTNVLSIVAAPVLVLMIPIFDTALVTVSRLLSGRSASQGGRDHSSHRLVAIGLSERRAVAALWLLAGIGGAIGVAIHYVNESWASLAVVIFLIGMALFAAYLSGIRVYEESDVRVRERRITPIVANFMYKRRVAEVMLDFCLVAVAYYGAYRLRFEDPEEFRTNFFNFSRSLPVVLAAQMLAFFVVGVYRGMWRHFGLMDTVVIAKGVFSGVVSAQLVILYVYRFSTYSRTVFAIYGVLLLVGVTLSRASFRLVGEYISRQRRSGHRVVVYGAGDGGTLVLRELQKRDDAAHILGFIDDDHRKIGIRVHGFPVLGDFGKVSDLVRRGGVEQIVISARSIDADRMSQLRALCARHRVGLTRLVVGLEEVVVVATDASHPRLLKVEL
jgi:UDP-GlcNAc:undecaprenyl-phosphate/decaprenyl-phosphate GlcNAc-1-phosphate transferase